jgi:CBS domain containing-hemolysin-like protein
MQMRILPRVVSDMALFEMLHIFESGGSHMAVIVEPTGIQTYNQDSSSSKYRTLGIVTLEDVIEEVLGSEVYRGLIIRL